MLPEYLRFHLRDTEKIGSKVALGSSSELVDGKNKLYL